MNTRNIFTKLSIAIALIAIASTVTIWEVRRVHAVTPPDPDRSFGMVGITHGQTVRLNVVNLSPPDPERQSPPRSLSRVDGGVRQHKWSHVAARELPTSARPRPRTVAAK
jgi:hypothetical protein